MFIAVEKKGQAHREEPKTERRSVVDEGHQSFVYVSTLGAQQCFFSDAGNIQLRKWVAFIAGQATSLSVDVRLLAQVRHVLKVQAATW
jgi:hypothetical protein